MFTGYYGRRRLRTLFNSCMIALVLIVVILYRRNSTIISKYLYQIYSEQKNIQHTLSNNISIEQNSIENPKLTLSTLKQWKTNNRISGILSSIEFYHSDLLDWDFDKTQIIPILVFSNASNIEIRDAIRRTWAFNQLYRNGSIKIKVFFFVGVDDFVQKRIYAEQVVCGDVIQVNLPDIPSYLAHKEFSAIVWFKNYLPSVPFYIKTEDNVIMNIKAIVDIVLPIIEQKINENVIISWFHSATVVSRGRYQHLVEAILPPIETDLLYALSLFYAVTSKAIDSMIRTLSNLRIVEYPGDPFLTGLIREESRVEQIDLVTMISSFTYEISDSGCRTTLQENSNILFCTVSENVRVTRLVMEYFDGWDTILTKNIPI